MAFFGSMSAPMIVNADKVFCRQRYLRTSIMPLSQTTQDAGYIEIPGEYTFWRTHAVPTEHVAFPLIVKSRIGPIGWLLLFPLAILLAIVGTACLVSLIGLDWTNRSPKEVIVGLPALLFVVYFAVLFVGVALRQIADRCAKLPLVEIDLNGILDRRLAPEKIAWKQVAHASAWFDRSGIAAVSLRLSSDAQAVTLRRRFDLLLRPLQRRPKEYFVEVKFLSVPQRRLALTILALVRANGGAIASNHPAEGDPLLARL
jgi:hypothetical protein